MKKKPSIFASIIGIMAIVLFIVLAFAVSPLIALLAGIALGYIIEFVTGGYVVTAFQLIGFEGVQSGDLPKVFGLMALVAYFFRLGTINTEKKRKGDD